jgi:hypothetical protein
MNKLNLAIDVLFCLDVVICFRTSYQDAEGIEILEGKKLAITYIKSGAFFIDFIGAVPIDKIVQSFLGPITLVGLLCKIRHKLYNKYI